MAEEYFGQSGVNLINHIINNPDTPEPVRSKFKYIRDNNSSQEINVVINKLLAYLEKNGVADQINNPYFFTQNEIDAPHQVRQGEGGGYGKLTGGMRIGFVLAAVMVTVRVVSGTLLSETVNYLKDAKYALQNLGDPFDEYQGPRGRVIVDLDQLDQFISMSYPLSSLPTQQELIRHARERSEARESEQKERARQERETAKKQADDKAVSDAVARVRSDYARKVEPRSAEADTTNYGYYGAALVLAIGVLAACGLNTSCKNKTGPLPLVNYNKIRQQGLKYNFHQPSSEYPFRTLEEACTAISEGYPLYVKKGETCSKIKTWNELRTYYGDMFPHIVVTKNDEMPRGGTKRRRRKSTKKK